MNEKQRQELINRLYIDKILMEMAENKKSGQVILHYKEGELKLIQQDLSIKVKIEIMNTE